MSAPESQPPDRTCGPEPADLPTARREQWDCEDDSLACTRIYCPNGDVLYCFPRLDDAVDTLLGTDAVLDDLFPEHQAGDKKV
jgi:hypothetical protein